MKKWTNLNGNKCFAIPKKSNFVKLWLIIVAIVIAAAICVTEYIVWGSHSLFTPVIVVLLLFFLWWVDIPIRKRDSIISETVHEIMDEVVRSDAKKVGRKVENSIVYHDYKGTYGIVESSFLLVYLDSGEVWEYPLVFHETEKRGEYFECVRSHIVSENQTHINTVTPERTNRILESHVLSEKAKLWLLIVFILFCGGFFAGCGVPLSGGFRIRLFGCGGCILRLSRFGILAVSDSGFCRVSGADIGFRGLLNAG